MWVDEAIYGLWLGDADRVSTAFANYVPGDQDVIVELMLAMTLRFEFEQGQRPSFGIFLKIAEYTAEKYEDYVSIAPYLLATLMWDLYYRDNRMEGIALGALAKAELETAAIARILRAHRAPPAAVQDLLDNAHRYYWDTRRRRAVG